MDTRCVVVVDEALPPGKAANAAAVIAMTLGTKVPAMIGEDFVDGLGGVHAGLFREGLPVLKAPSSELTLLRARAVAADVGVVGMPVNGHQTNDYEAFVEMVGSSASVSYLGLALYGPARVVRSLTGSLALLR